MNQTYVVSILVGIPLICFASAGLLEFRRDRGAFRHLVRMLPITIGGSSSLLLLSLLSDSIFPSNPLCTGMSLTGLFVAVCAFFGRHKSRLAAVLIVLGGLLLTIFWLGSRPMV